MHRLINGYYRDLNGTALSSLPIDQAFNFVKNIPYRQDTAPIEVVSRPEISLNNRKVGIDCKKKSILLASYLRGRDIPYRLIASSRRPNRKIHHVFPQMNFLNGVWLNFDATYNHYKPFEPKRVTNAEVLR